jgi:hypothetical protein
MTLARLTLALLEGFFFFDQSVVFAAFFSALGLT